MPTQCPEEFTQCPNLPTECPEVVTECPPDVNTICPEVATSCPGGATTCGSWLAATLCPDGSGGTWTVCPAKATYCPILPGECNPNPSDLNLDGIVDINDLIVVRNNHRSDPLESGVVGDVNGDGRINILDMIYVRNHFQHLSRQSQ